MYVKKKFFLKMCYYTTFTLITTSQIEYTHLRKHSTLIGNFFKCYQFWVLEMLPFEADFNILKLAVDYFSFANKLGYNI